MPITLLRQDKNEVIHLIERALKLLAFPKLSATDASATMQHLEAMRIDPRQMDVLCQLQADESGRTVLTITCAFQKIAPMGAKL